MFVRQKMINKLVLVIKSFVTPRVPEESQRNVRRKSTSEKMLNIVRSRKSRIYSRNGGDVSQPQVKFF